MQRNGYATHERNGDCSGKHKAPSVGVQTHCDGNMNHVLAPGHLDTEAVKRHLKQMRRKMEQALEEHLDDFASLVETELTGETKKLTPIDGSVKPKERDYGFREKKFVMRESLLTDLFNTKDIQTIYNFFLAILVLLILNTFALDILDEGKLNLSFELITWGFGKTPVVITIWLCMFGSTLVLYPVFRYWAYIPRLPGVVESGCWIGLYLAYLGCLFYFPTYYLYHFELAIGSGSIIVCEQIRLIMKVHAFVRENIPRALQYKSTITHRTETVNVNSVLPCGQFEKYVYFSFAPTLLYRDEYPRNKKIDWYFAVSNAVQAVGCVFYTQYIFSRFCVPVFRNFNTDHVTLKNFVLAAFSCILPGMLVLVVLFWGLLHTWMNAFAEVLRFGDRLFYKDWWNSTSFGGYYRTWNVIIHDWLYAYVYRDIVLLLKGGGKARVVAALTVFMMSALVHEYVFWSAYRFCYPIMLFLFGVVGGFFFFFTGWMRLQRMGNVFMWFNLMIGNGIMMSLYSMEWYARRNCLPNHDGLLDVLIPRSWNCRH